jgi:hypothetical protein
MMGLVGDLLVLITAFQESRDKNLERMIEGFLDYATWKIINYIYQNNGFSILARHAKEIEKKYPLFAEIIRRRAIHDWRTNEKLGLKDTIEQLSKRNIENYVEPDAENLLIELLKRNENPILLADKLIYFQHKRGGLFDEDLDAEYEYAEETLSSISLWG